VAAGNTVLGVEELSKDFQRLEAAAAAKIMRSAAGYAFTPVLSNIKANAPVSEKAHTTRRDRIVTPGFLKRNLVKKTKVSRDKSRAFVSIFPKPEAFYGFVFVPGGITRFGKGSPNDFATRGFEAAEGQAIQRFSEKMKIEIEKAAAK